MEEDRTETNNLAADMPGKTSELIAAYDSWAANNLVKPWPIR